MKVITNIDNVSRETFVTEEFDDFLIHTDTYSENEIFKIISNGKKKHKIVEKVDIFFDICWSTAFNMSVPEFVDYICIRLQTNNYEIVMLKPFDYYVDEPIPHIRVHFDNFKEYTKGIKLIYNFLTPNERELKHYMRQNPTANNYSKKMLHFDDKREYHKGKALLMTWDIEVYSKTPLFNSFTRTKNIEEIQNKENDKENDKEKNTDTDDDDERNSFKRAFPIPENPDDEIFMIGFSLHYHDSEKPLAAGVFLSFYPDKAETEKMVREHEDLKECEHFVFSRQQSEYLMLKTFFKFIENVRPDVMTGFNDHMFDWDYLKRRMRTHYRTHTELWDLYYRAFNYDHNNKYSNRIGSYPPNYSRKIKLCYKDEETKEEYKKLKLLNKRVSPIYRKLIEGEEIELQKEQNLSFFLKHLKEFENLDDDISSDLADNQIIDTDHAFNNNNAIKIGAGEMVKGITPKSDNIVFIDVRTCYRKLFPNERESNLNFYLKMMNLGNKIDVSFDQIYDACDEAFILRQKIVDAKTTKGFDLKSKGLTLEECCVYCMIDAIKCQRLLVKKEVIDEYVKIGEICRLPLGDINRANKHRIENLLLEYGRDTYSFRFNVRKEDNMELDEKRTGVCSQGKFKGAYVKDPIPGLKLVAPIVGLDFSSLYPSIMRAFNISPDTMVDQYLEPNNKKVHIPKITYPDNCNYQPDAETSGVLSNKFAHPIILNGKDEYYEFKLDNIDIHIINGNKRPDKQGLFPKVLEDLGARRVAARVQLNKDIGLRGRLSAEGKDIPADLNRSIRDANQKQLAIKVLMNSSYGVMGAEISGGLYKREAAEIVTSLGRTLLQTVINFIESTGEYIIHYGDTDSTYVSLTDDHIAIKEIEDAYRTNRVSLKEMVNMKINVTRSMAKELQSRVNNMLKTLTGSKYLSMAYEEVLFPMINFNVKKTYMGIEHKDENLEIEVTDHSLFIRGGSISKYNTPQITIHIVKNMIMKRLFSYDMFEKFEQIRVIKTNVPTNQILSDLVLEVIKETINTIAVELNKDFSEDCNFKYDWFIRMAKYNPNTKSETIMAKVFRNRMIAEGKPIPEAGEKFEFVIVKKDKGKSKGDTAEYPFIAKEQNMRLNFDEYFESSMLNDLVAFIPHEDGFKDIEQTHRNKIFASKLFSLLVNYPQYWNQLESMSINDIANLKITNKEITPHLITTNKIETDETKFKSKVKKVNGEIYHTFLNNKYGHRWPKLIYIAKLFTLSCDRSPKDFMTQFKNSLLYYYTGKPKTFDNETYMNPLEFCNYISEQPQFVEDKTKTFGYITNVIKKQGVTLTTNFTQILLDTDCAIYERIEKVIMTQLTNNLHSNWVNEQPIKIDIAATMLLDEIEHTYFANYYNSLVIKYYN